MTPLAGAVLVIGANVPDVDIFTSFAGDYQSIALRRGWTHGVLALALWPFVLTALLLAWDRFVRRRRDPSAAPARAGPLLVLAAVAVTTHPTLDWLNNYGLRWLMPFDERWFYGDALFIIDPWIWLLLGGAAFLTFSKSRVARIRWTVFFALTTVVIFANAGLAPLSSTALVPMSSAVLWVAGVAALVRMRWRFRDAPDATLERAAQVGVAVAVVYSVAMLAASAAARDDVRTTVAAQGIEAEDVMVAPSPADPFHGEVVVMTRDEYYLGLFDWFGEPRLELEERRVPRPRGAVYEAAARQPAARRFLVWSRFPAIEVESTGDGAAVVRFLDVRYHETDRISGPVVRVDGRALGGD